MNKQVTVCLSNDLLDFVDEQVEAGERTSRAAVVICALERERRRAMAARDAEVLARAGLDPDLDGLAQHVQGLFASESNGSA